MKADIIFLIDSSGSVRFHWAALLQAINDLIDSFMIGRENVRVGVIQFGDLPYVEVRFDDYMNATTKDLSKKLLQQVL